MTQTFVRVAKSFAENNSMMFFQATKNGIGGYYISSGAGSLTALNAAAVESAILNARKHKRTVKDKDAAQRALDRWRKKADSEEHTEETEW